MPLSENIRKRKLYRKTRLFFLFFVLSVFFWVLLTLSSTYSYWTNVKLNVQHNVKDKFLQENPIDEIKVKVKTTGFNMIFLYFFPKNIKIETTDFKQLESYKYFYLPNKNLPVLQKQWNELEMEHFENDTIEIFLGQMKQKYIPVRPQFEYHLEKGHLLDQPLQYSFDSVLVSGPEKFLNEIKFIHTEKLHLDKIKSDFDIQIPLDFKQSSAKYLVFKDSILKISGKVSKYTELQMTLPIKIQNNESLQKVSIYPKTATLYYQVSLKNYAKITPNDFEISAILPLKNKPLVTFLPLQLTKKPDFITRFRIEPGSINYLIDYEQN